MTAGRGNVPKEKKEQHVQAVPAAQWQHGKKWKVCPGKKAGESCELRASSNTHDNNNTNLEARTSIRNIRIKPMKPKE